MTRNIIFLVTVDRAQLDELVHERMFRTEAEAIGWATPFHKDGFRVGVHRFRRDSGYGCLAWQHKPTHTKGQEP